MAQEHSEEQVNLSSLSPLPGSRKKKRRVGIGEGSGKGKTCGRGQKGQLSRSGASIPAGFEGGQMPLYRRLPKRGFTSRKKVRGENIFQLVPLEKLETLGIEGSITIDILNENGLISSTGGKVKILGGVKATKKYSVEVHKVTASAKAAIEAAGGTVTLL